jgi:membrane protease YdiL (CAAX protease family)
MCIPFLFFWFTQNIIHHPEEFFFRGLIYKIAKNKTKNTLLIIGIEVVLFTIAHVYYINRVPYSLWVLVPCAGFLFGFLSIKYKSLTYSLVSHGLFNGLYNFMPIIISLIIQK